MSLGPESLSCTKTRPCSAAARYHHTAVVLFWVTPIPEAQAHAISRISFRAAFGFTSRAAPKRFKHHRFLFAKTWIIRLPARPLPHFPRATALCQVHVPKAHLSVGVGWRGTEEYTYRQQLEQDHQPS
eukprot:4638011-Amphidinium_carterae.2